jgi:acetyl-CoA C-acetyltransferase
MGKVAIIGVGQSEFVRSYPGSVRELAFEGFKEAMGHARVTTRDIQASIICSAPEYDKQRSPAGVLAEYLGLNPQPTFYVESLCSSSSMGLRLAYSWSNPAPRCRGGHRFSEDVRDHLRRVPERMAAAPTSSGRALRYHDAGLLRHVCRAHGRPWNHSGGPGAHPRQAATYGQLNDKAVYRKPVTLRQSQQSGGPHGRPVASPLRVGDCCANADGSSCVIVASEEKAKVYCQKPVWILGLGAATTSVNLAGRDLFTGLTVAREASRQAYKMAGVAPKDIDVAEVHDCFTIAEMMAYEDLGFAKPGEGKELIRSKATYKEGHIPVNVDGGLLSKGHPIGATGGSQIRTVVLQLREEAGLIQVKSPEIGLVHNIGGVGLYGNVSILGR